MDGLKAVFCDSQDWSK